MASRYYTGSGDKGETGIPAGGRVAKSDALIDAVGSVDELNSSIGVSLFYVHDDNVRKLLRGIQNELFIIGANLASTEASKPEKAMLDDEAVIRLEEQIKRFGEKLPDLKQFVIPSGCEGAVHLHLARAIARRAERKIVAASERYGIDKRVIAYMNRLSSFLFVTALYLNYSEGVDEEHPTY